MRGGGRVEVEQTERREEVEGRDKKRDISQSNSEY